MNNQPPTAKGPQKNSKDEGLPMKEDPLNKHRKHGVEEPTWPWQVVSFAQKTRSHQ